MSFPEKNLISLDRVRALQASEVGSRSVTLRLSGKTLELFNELETALGSPGAMAYFRDGLWLAALAISHDVQGNRVKLNVEYVDLNKKHKKENILDGFRLHALRKWVNREPLSQAASQALAFRKHARVAKGAKQ